MRLRVVLETDPAGLVRLQHGGFEVDDVSIAPGWQRQQRSLLSEIREAAAVARVAPEVPQAAAVAVPAAATEVRHVGEPDRSNQSEPARDATEVAAVENSAPAEELEEQAHAKAREGNRQGGGLGAFNTGAPGPSPADEAGPLPQVLPPPPPTVATPAAVMGGGKPASWRTAERRAVLLRDWPTDRPKGAIIAEMERLPGPAVNRPQLAVWATQIGVRRPDSALSPKELALRNHTADRLAARRASRTSPRAALPAQAVAPLPAAAPAPVRPAVAPPVVERAASAPLKGTPRGPVPRLPAAGFDGKVLASFEEIKAWAAYYGIAYDGGNMDVVNRRRQLNGQPQIVQEGP